MGVWPTERNAIEEVVMAKVIEFYVPKNFRKPLKFGLLSPRALGR